MCLGPVLCKVLDQPVIDDGEKCFPHFKGRRKNHLAHWYMRTILLSGPMVFKSSLTLEELPRWLSGKRTHLAVQEMQETWVRSLGQEDPLEKEINPLQCFCLENSLSNVHLCFPRVFS